MTLLAQEQGPRAGTAAAAGKFDSVIAAPGSEVTAMLVSVYLQPTDAPLLPEEVWTQIAGEPDIAFAAPRAFGDSVGGYPIVGTTRALIDHLTDGLPEGRPFAAPGEAVIKHDVALALGARFEPAHGVRFAAMAHAHEGIGIEVVDRMPRLGSP